MRRSEVHLLPHQLELVADRTSKVRVLQGGYRSGKTVAGVAAVLDMGLRGDGDPVLVVEPTYRMALDVFVATARRMLDAWAIPYEWKASAMTLTIGRRKRFDVLCRSADNPRSLEGLTVGGLLVDEWELCDPIALGVAMARVSIGPVQQIVLTGTPEGYGPAYEMILARPEPTTRVWTVRSKANAYLRESYVDDMAKRLDDDVAQEKLEGIRTAKGGRVYSRFDRAVHCGAPCVTMGEIQVAADFNVGFMHWLICETDPAGRRTHVVGEVIGKNTDTAEQAERVAHWIAQYVNRTRRRVVSRRDVFDMHIPVFCDASGNARSAVTPLTHVALLHQAGFRPKHGAANPLVADRVNTLQVLLRDRRVTVDAAAAPWLVKGLEQQAYDGQGAPDKRGDLDHGLDALGYLAHWQMPVWRPAPNTVDHHAVPKQDAWGI